MPRSIFSDASPGFSCLNQHRVQAVNDEYPIKTADEIVALHWRTCNLFQQKYGFLKARIVRRRSLRPKGLFCRGRDPSVLSHRPDVLREGDTFSQQFPIGCSACHCNQRKCRKEAISCFNGEIASGEVSIRQERYSTTSPRNDMKLSQGNFGPGRGEKERSGPAQAALMLRGQVNVIIPQWG
jgi:hypothetical protein